MNDSNNNTTDILSYESCLAKAATTRIRFLELSRLAVSEESRLSTLRMGEMLASVYDAQAKSLLNTRW